jgi:hypothetical protein
VVATLSITDQLAEQARNDRKRKERLFEAAKTFARKVAGSTSIHEVALCGSMVTEDPYPQGISSAVKDCLPEGLACDFWPQNKVKTGTGYFLNEKRKIAGCWSDQSMLRFIEEDGGLQPDLECLFPGARELAN